MNQLPSSIEAYLEDAGFSGTEVLILRKLLEEDALTIRELASKTGKSTGVLDQAMKKLLKKRIITREIINGAPKYIVQSLDPVLHWMKDDTEQKQQMIVRKYQNFEAFIATLQKGKTRPEMEYFEGLDGMKRAYMELLKRGKVFCTYGPTLWTAEEDPLRDFRVQYFRERRMQGAFSRVITNDTPLGRRAQSRDAFEYRQTVLVDSERYPFKFEKTIVGDTVACFQLREQRACFIRFNELAEEERAFFELLWYKKTAAQKEADANEKPDLPLITIEARPSVSTRLFSQLREFFLSKRSLAMVGACALLAATCTFLLYQQNYYFNLQRIREQVKSIAATGAVQFDANDLEQLHSKSDITKPEYVKVIRQLNVIRDQNPGIVYAYIMRPTNESGIYEYVADADSLNPDVIVDVNKDGKIDEADANVIPGEKYVASDEFLKNDIFDVPTANEKPYTDKWGTFIDGTAPIKDANGNIKALLGVNKWAADVNTLTSQTFQPIAWFFLFFLIFTFVRLAAFNRSLFNELCTLVCHKKAYIALGSSVAIAGILTAAIYFYTNALNLKRIQDKVISIAATGALQFNIGDLNELRTVEDIAKPQYAKVIGQLNEIRKQGIGIQYAYIMRPTNKSGIWEFVADADSLDPFAKKDLNGDGIINDADALSPPGQEYDSTLQSGGDNKEALNKAISIGPGWDQWGNLISGWAPIKDQQGKTQAIFGLDIFTDKVAALTLGTIDPVKYFIGIFVVSLLLFIGILNRAKIVKHLRSLQWEKVIVIIGSSVIVSSIITFSFYQYIQSITLNRMKDKVLAIAITAASQFDARDLNTLKVKDDWEKPEWGKVGNQLLKIKQENIDITYAYIIRKLQTDPQKMEFVADADSINPFANTDNDPTNDIDMNRDGKIDGSPTGGDYQAWPGQPYVTIPDGAFDAYNGPRTSNDFYEDQWGSMITGYAPIKDRQGEVAALLAIDMSNNEQHYLTKEVFSPIYVFIFSLAILLFPIQQIFRKFLKK